MAAHQKEFRIDTSKVIVDEFVQAEILRKKKNEPIRKRQKKSTGEVGSPGGKVHQRIVYIIPSM
ncbi:MAG: hypothetical protein WBV11_04595 [Salegentibacter sp.]